MMSVQSFALKPVMPIHPCSRCYTGSILFVKMHSGSVLMASDCSFHILCILIKYIALKHLLLFNGLCKHGIGDSTCT